MPPGLASTVLFLSCAWAKYCASIAMPWRARSWLPSTRVPPTMLCSIWHIEWSSQRMPTPSAALTSLPLAMSIDISPSEIPRSVVSRMWFDITSTADEWVTIPSRTPAIVQCDTMLIARPIEYEMSTPCTHGPDGSAIVQLSIMIPASRTWIASTVTCSTRTWSSMTCDACSTSMPFSPPTTVTWRIVTLFERTTMPPSTVPPVSVSGWRITSGPCTVPCRCTVGGRVAYAAPSPPTTTAATATAVNPPPRPSSPPASPYSSRARGKSACAQSCAASQPMP